MTTVRQTIDNVNSFVKLGGQVNLRTNNNDGWQGQMVSANGKISVVAQGETFELCLAALFDKLNDASEAA